MEYRTSPERPVRRDRTSWIWLLVVLLAIALVLVIWWAVAAKGREGPAATPEPEEMEAERPAVAPSPEQPPSEQPIVVEREQPVNIYVQPEEPSMRVIVVPQGERPPQAKERLRKVDLPGRFRYQHFMWEPTNEAFTEDAVDLRDTGAMVDGNIIYVQQHAERPYDELFLETEPGSGVFVKYGTG